MRRGDHGSRSRAAAATLALLLSGTSLLSGCGLLGGPQQLSEDFPRQITVNSPVFDKGVIPTQFTCKGGQSPPIFWTDIPKGTKSVALIVDDSDAPITPKVYWIVFDISPDTTDIQAGILPPRAREAQNSLGKASYDPPCPAGGSHQYRFTVYALNTVLKSLKNGAQLLPTWTAIASHVIARGRLTATAEPQS